MIQLLSDRFWEIDNKIKIMKDQKRWESEFLKEKNDVKLMKLTRLNFSKD